MLCLAHVPHCILQQSSSSKRPSSKAPSAVDVYSLAESERLSGRCLCADEWHRQAIPRTKNAVGVFLACLVVGASGLLLRHSCPSLSKVQQGRSVTVSSLTSHIRLAASGRSITSASLPLLCRLLHCFPIFFFFHTPACISDTRSTAAARLSSRFRPVPCPVRHDAF